MIHLLYSTITGDDDGDGYVQEECDDHIEDDDCEQEDCDGPIDEDDCDETEVECSEDSLEMSDEEFGARCAILEMN